MNTFGIIFAFGIPGLMILTLAALSIYQFAAEHRREKQRDKRWRTPVSYWWELKVDE